MHLWAIPTRNEYITLIWSDLTRIVIEVVVIETHINSSLNLILSIVTISTAADTLVLGTRSIILEIIERSSLKFPCEGWLTHSRCLFLTTKDDWAWFTSEETRWDIWVFWKEHRIRIYHYYLRLRKRQFRPLEGLKFILLSHSFLQLFPEYLHSLIAYPSIRIHPLFNYCIWLWVYWFLRIFMVSFWVFSSVAWNRGCVGGRIWTDRGESQIILELLLLL